MPTAGSPVCSPIRTCTAQPSGHSCAACARCASTAASTASRAREREEERVALRVDLDPVTLRERLAHQPAVVGEDGVVALAELLQQPVEPSMSLKTNVTVPLGS